MKHIKTKPLLYLFGLLFVWNCQKESEIEKAIAEIPMNVQIERFDRLLSEANGETIGDILKKYPFMFTEITHDSILLNQINDEYEQMLFVEVDSAFQNLEYLEKEIEDLFRHLKYYNKSFHETRVITRTSFVDYRNKIIVTDSFTLIGLDTYLGESHEFYTDIHDYIAQNLTQEMIISDMAGAFAESYIPPKGRRTFLDEMIYHGKILYFKDLVIPSKSDANKIGYTQEHLDWAKNNEPNIWGYFIEEQLLFSTDVKLFPRFINPAPFSKFNLALDNESPGRIGQYMGWQIVRAYMKNNKVSLGDLFNADAETIFNNSKFKPRK